MFDTTHTSARVFRVLTHTHMQEHVHISVLLYARKLYAQFICIAYCRDFELDFATSPLTTTCTLHAVVGPVLQFTVLFTLYKK